MSLPKRYEAKEAEKKWLEAWEKQGIYRFDWKDKEKAIYSCDTPPPTVSGKMHMGHALAYSQADFVMRFQRMQGKNIFYPFGFDDNGLATERFVERKCSVKGNQMPRPEFVKLCLNETTEAEEELKKNWSSLGISPDWSISYRTIDEWCTKTSQRSFIELYAKGREYRKEYPIMWCPLCQTAIAQVELKDKRKNSFLNYISFDVEGGKKLTIATTRPELMPACVAIFVHPEDKRYRELVGKKVKIPFFGQEVKIYSNEAVDPEYGTGAVYHCTFGDADDIEWVEKYGLPVIKVMNKDGTLNEKAGKYAGMSAVEARKAILQDLENEGRLEKQEQISHVVNTHERCDAEIEFVMTKQWFIKYLDLKEKFLEEGAKLNWHPEYMKTRYDNWVKGLKWDWCISRQRFFGIPFPVWYCKKCGEIMVAEESWLPVDPLVDKPKKACKCGSNEFEGEKDVLDTWATSSLTPQIATKWKEDEKFFKKINPMSLRSNGHDIITFWLFNTVVKSLLHENRLPWKDVMINGFVLDPHGKKMSKSKGNVVDPLEVLGKYGADALRFWAASTKLGDDIPYQEKELVSGQKFMTKLWNASSFCLMHLKDHPIQEPKKFNEMDKWILSKLNKLVKECTDSFKEYEYSKTKNQTEYFFWHVFCDNYLEIVKDRLYNPHAYTREEVCSARFTLYGCLLYILKLMAPIMPFITEEIYSHYFAEKEKKKSIHLSPWPEFNKEMIDEEAEKKGELAVEIISAVRQFKSTKDLALNKPIKKLTIESKRQKELEKVLVDLKATVKAEEIKFEKTKEIQVNEDSWIKIEMCPD